MARFITDIARFLGMLLVLYLLSLVIIYFTGLAKYIPNVLDKSKNDGFLLTRLRELPNYREVDYLFLGSSHACREFDPRIFAEYGFSSFNLGSSAQTPINSKYLFQKYVDSLAPKHLIFEVYFRFFEREPTESSLDIISNSEIDSYNLNIALSRPTLKIYNTIAFIAVNRWFQPLAEIKQQRFKWDRYVSGGYIEKVLSDSINKNPLKLVTRQHIQPREDQIQAVRDILQIASEKNIKVTLVSAPVTKEFFSQFENYDKFHELVNDLCTEYQVRYIDYNLMTTPDFSTATDFYDNNHLNQQGVSKFNNHLIQSFLLKL
ncbi:MAG: hypothetical protein R2820_02400 [Cyclobacteriaceae bacterium]